jgi:hypothetical protein
MGGLAVRPLTPGSDERLRVLVVRESAAAALRFHDAHEDLAKAPRAAVPALARHTVEPIRWFMVSIGLLVNGHSCYSGQLAVEP